jgi:hypothetical protein
MSRVVALSLLVVVMGCKHTELGAGPPCAFDAECGSCERCDTGRCEPVDEAECTPRECSDLSEPLDVASIADPDVHLPHLVWTGERYAMTWYDAFVGSYFAFLDDEGVEIPGSVETLSTDALFPRVAFNGAEYAVVYVDEDAPFENRRVVFARVDLDGRVVPGSQVLVTPDGAPEMPTIVWNPVAREWGVMWEEHDPAAVYFARVDAAGQLVAGSELLMSDPEVIGHTGGSGNPLRFTGDGYALIWTESDAPVGSVVLSLIDHGGAIVNTSRLPQADPNPVRASVVADGEGFGAVWMSPDGTLFWQVHYMRADRDGNFLPETGQLFGDSSRHDAEPTITWTGDGYGVAWAAQDSTTADIWYATVDRETGAVDERALTSAPNRQWWPHMVYDGCANVIAFATESGGGQYGHVLFVP